MKYLMNIICTLVLSSTVIMPILADYTQRYSAITEHTDSWSFLEELTIHQPQRSVGRWFGPRGIAAGTALCASYLMYRGSHYALGTSNKLTSTIAFGSGITAGLASYYALQMHALHQAEHDHLAKLMKRWPELRNRIPHEVWPMLDLLYHAWLHNKASYENQVDEVLSYLKAEVYAKFPTRYKATSESFFTSRHVSVQVQLNLYKFAKAAYATLKGFFE